MAVLDGVEGARDMRLLQESGEHKVVSCVKRIHLNRLPESNRPRVGGFPLL